MHRTLALLLVLAGCAADTSEYDPDFAPDQPLADGKADGIYDAIPDLAFDAPQSGDVGGERVEFFKLQLNRDERIRLEMRVDSGNLNPHMSFYYGISTYVSSATWERDGDVLRKEYVAESTGTYVLAMRAYQGEGEGDYTVTATCLAGVCAGDMPPPPESDLYISEVAGCITAARRCAFERLPRYDGRVGEARAALLFQECLAEATVDDGGTCASVCDWVNPDDERDTAADLCNPIIEALPFYADASPACLGELDYCMSDCHYYAGHDYGDELYYTTEAICWSSGLNGDCNSYAREHEDCGGRILADSAAECDNLCESTSGAFTDDISDICGRDAGCDDYCDVDLAAAGEACGGLTSENERCLYDQLDLTGAWVCENQLDEALAGT